MIKKRGGSSLKDLKKKTVALISSFALLVVLLVAFTYGWYTRMVSVSGIEFKAAKWDFSANYQTDTFKINVYQYAQLTQQKAAPGTSGEIALSLTSKKTDSDVAYMVSLDEKTMSSEFQKRIHFYYLDSDSNPVYFTKADGSTNQMSGTIPKKTASDVVIYWHWLYDYDEYLTFEEKDDYLEIANILKSKTEQKRIAFFNNESAVLQSNDGGIFTATELTKLNQYKASQESQDQFVFSSFWSEYQKAYEDWDKFDTAAGENTALYEAQMAATLSVVGEQVEPTQVN